MPPQVILTNEEGFLSMEGRITIERILDIARWAPSGDNTQPWRFEIVDSDSVIVHGFDTRKDCVYDLQGRASQLSIGALLETIAIAASTYGLRVETRRRCDAPDVQPTFDIKFSSDIEIMEDPLVRFITERSVQRRRLRVRPLTLTEKQVLEASVGVHYQVKWLEGWANRFRAARLMFRNAKLRMIMPEAYQVHRRVIEWNASYSEDRIPQAALGVSAPTAWLMRWVMRSWARVEFFNTYLAGTLIPRLEMDFVPSLACAAHVVIAARKTPETIDDYILAGRSVQRFWLTATKLGLRHQPEMTPLIFAGYLKADIAFTKNENVKLFAASTAADTFELIGDDMARAVWIGRIGEGPAAKARSRRLSLETLLVSDRR
ncbi:nitroreductase family protein [Methylibium sp.]|uniref:nitroreductase family protein n=1 Tax=Methylibium sp. TaxID=2067992 RepID=UPI0025D9CAD3|nr:nitroreductase family protein [Methylibium sp.]